MRAGTKSGFKGGGVGIWVLGKHCSPRQILPHQRCREKQDHLDEAAEGAEEGGKQEKEDVETKQAVDAPRKSAGTPERVAVRMRRATAGGRRVRAARAGSSSSSVSIHHTRPSTLPPRRRRGLRAGLELAVRRGQPRTSRRERRGAATARVWRRRQSVASRVSRRGAANSMEERAPQLSA